MDIETVIRAHGGSATWTQLRGYATRRQIEAALQGDRIFRVRRGVYSLKPRRIQSVAAEFNGVISHHTAAELQNLGTIVEEQDVHFTVPKNRSRQRTPERLRVHYADLSPDEIFGIHTTPFRTALDCAKVCPFPRALAIAETVVRTRDVDPEDLRTAATSLRGSGSARARKVMSAVDKRPQSPMESILRGILIDAGITRFQPQFEVLMGEQKVATADLGDPETGILIEADSFMWHGTRQALADDCRRYDEFVALGYAVLRFAYEHVRYEPQWIVETVRRTVERRVCA